MNYSKTIDYLYSRLPMFSRIGSSAIKKDLTNTIELCKRLNDPQHKFKSVHVAGTNGKGSTSHMLAAILQKAGYKTGLYTSPHLRDFRERIKINGEMITEGEVIAFVETQQKNINEIEPSFFEVTVAMAFNHFERHQVDIAIIEVGLGGRLDSTNIITPLLSVVTNISLDHTNILGHTLPKIAYEKAGIIKPNIPVVIGQKQTEVEDVFTKKAEETGSEITFASEEWKILTAGDKEYSERDWRLLRVIAQRLGPDKPISNTLFLKMDLNASYQLKNLPTVLSSVVELRRQGFNITDADISEALAQVKQLTGLLGRWQVISEKPLVICDTGHNEDGIREVVENLRATPHENLHFVLGMLKDKDITTVLQLLPKEATYYFCKPDVERGKQAEDLANEAQLHGLAGSVYPSVQAALNAAKATANEKDLIFVGGSTFVVAEVI
jgi:dihydrofolate synthase / folylpolyglutamate synthase